MAEICWKVLGEQKIVKGKKGRTRNDVAAMAAATPEILTDPTLTFVSDEGGHYEIVEYL